MKRIKRLTIISAVMLVFLGIKKIARKKYDLNNSLFFKECHSIGRDRGNFYYS